MAVKVFARFRPQTAKEALSGGELAVKKVSGQTFSISDEKGEDSRFTFDGVFYSEASQEDVYTAVAEPVVADVLAFGNGAVICYGQTGAGKTHTMEGEGLLQGASPSVGIVPRVASAIFDGLKNTKKNSATIKLSVIEVYLERIRDLFDHSKDHLALKDDPVDGTIVFGATEIEVTDFSEMLRLLKGALENRAVAETGMNNASSRSHCVYTITITGTDGNSGVRTGKFHLVDLAGSEKVDKTGAEGMTLNEAKSINKSLSALGNVIYALTKGSTTHVPFRDSKLTRILQSSLAGRSQTSLVCCCSPSTVNKPETLSTIRFGVRAKEIKEPPAPAPQPKIDYKAMYNNMQQDFEALKSQCKQLEDTVARLSGNSLSGAMMRGSQGSPRALEGYSPAVRDLRLVKTILEEVYDGACVVGISEATSMGDIEAILNDELAETLSQRGGPSDATPENDAASDEMRELCKQMVAENIGLLRELILCSTAVL